jgi:hypothetical protein
MSMTTPRSSWLPVGVAPALDRQHDPGNLPVRPEVTLVRGVPVDLARLQFARELRLSGPVVRMGDPHEAFAILHFFASDAANPQMRVVDQPRRLTMGARVRERDADWHRVENELQSCPFAFELFARARQLCFRRAFLAHIPEHQHDAQNVPLSIADGRGAVSDGALRTITCHEQRVVLQRVDFAGRQDGLHREHRRAAALLFDDVEDLLDGPADCLRFWPSGQPLRDFIHPDDLALGVGREHAVAD